MLKMVCPSPSDLGWRSTGVGGRQAINGRVWLASTHGVAAITSTPASTPATAAFEMRATRVPTSGAASTSRGSSSRECHGCHLK